MATALSPDESGPAWPWPFPLPLIAPVWRTNENHPLRCGQRSLSPDESGSYTKSPHPCRSAIHRAMRRLK